MGNSTDGYFQPNDSIVRFVSLDTVVGYSSEDFPLIYTPEDASVSSNIFSPIDKGTGIHYETVQKEIHSCLYSDTISITVLADIELGLTETQENYTIKILDNIATIDFSEKILESTVFSIDGMILTKSNSNKVKVPRNRQAFILQFITESNVIIRDKVLLVE